MFEIANNDTTFNEWEQALAAVLQYEFKCKRQAEWQLFGDDTGTLRRIICSTNEKSTLRKTR